MKKLLLLAVLCGATMSAYAMQCPPADRFSHAAVGSPWVLDAGDPEWTVGGVYGDDAQSAFTQLDKDTKVEAMISRMAGTGDWYTSCGYFLSDNSVLGAGYKHIIPAKRFDPAKNPAFKAIHGGNDYVCNTTAGVESACKWST